MRTGGWVGEWTREVGDRVPPSAPPFLGLLFILTRAPPPSVSAPGPRTAGPARLCSEPVLPAVFVVKFCQPPAKQSKGDRSEVSKLKKAMATFPPSGSVQGTRSPVLPHSWTGQTLRAAGRGRRKAHGWAASRTSVETQRAGGGWSGHCPDPPAPLGILCTSPALGTRTPGPSPASVTDATATVTRGLG